MKIPILMYHQIDAPPPKGTPLRGLVVAPSSFSWQMRLLDLLGFKGLSMRDLEPYLKGEKTGKVVGLTFDDGYQNNLINAMPILQRHRFTATCYGVSSMIGGWNSWDKGKVARKPLMTLTDWRRWRDGDMDIGSHTCTHAKLTELSEAESRKEITESRLALEEALQYEVRHFCYPYGWYTGDHTAMVQQAGYMTATTTNRGRASESDSLFTLPRIMVARATNPIQFVAKIISSYEDKRQ